MRRLSSHFTDQVAPERMMTPSSVGLSRNLSLLASRMGQPQNGQYSFLMGLESNIGSLPSRLDPFL